MLASFGPQVAHELRAIGSHLFALSQELARLKHAALTRGHGRLAFEINHLACELRQAEVRHG